MNEEFFKAKDIHNASLVIAGAPFDSTTSFRPGSRFGPMAIRNNLYGLESYSPYLSKDMENYKIFDMGDIEVCYGNAEITLLNIQDELSDVFNQDKKVILLGGEHLVSLGAIKALKNQHEEIFLIHFDAHTDMRENYMGEELSHACVMRRAGEITGFENIFQFGIRSGTDEEWDFSEKNCNIFPFNFEALDDVLKSIPLDAPIYLSIDLDVLDPAYFPGTGTPEPMGVKTQDLHNALISLNNHNIIAADLVELAPDYDNSGNSSITAAFFLRELSLIMV